MKRLFTTTFFRLTHSDQVAVMEAHLRELYDVLGRVQEHDKPQIRRSIRYIEKKAVEYGLWKADDKTTNFVRMNSKAIEELECSLGEPRLLSVEQCLEVLG